MFDFFLRRPRLTLFAFGLVCYGAVGSAFVLGEWMHIEPCAMCWFQRLSFLLAGTGFLLAAAWPRAQIVTKRIAELGLLLALESAVRQSFLIIHPEAAKDSCSAGLFYYLQIEDYVGFLRAGMLGGIDCAENQPLILGLQLPQWSLLAVVCILATYITWHIVSIGSSRMRRIF